MGSSKHAKLIMLEKAAKHQNAHFTFSTDQNSKPSGRFNKKPSGDSLPQHEVDSIKLDDGALVDVVEDTTDADSTSLAIFRDDKTRFAKSLNWRGQMLVPIPRTAPGFSHVSLPSGIAPYESEARLAVLVGWFLRTCVDLPPEFIHTIACFVLYTWLADRLPNTVYLSVIGLPQSGKSTLLEVLSLICRRALLVSDITRAALLQSCSRFQPTLLIDEVEWNSLRSAAAIRQLLRAGTSRSSRTLRVNGTDSCFGPKVLGSLEVSPDQALNTRCVQIPMAETKDPKLLRSSDPRVRKEAAEIRRALLSFRFHN